MKSEFVFNIITDLENTNCRKVALLVKQNVASDSNCFVFDFESGSFDSAISKYIVILPIYGENELICSYSDKLTKMLLLSDFDDGQFLFLLIGDVHVSDDAAFLDMPIIKQLKYKLLNFVEPVIYPVKLSQQRLVSDGKHYFEMGKFICAPLPSFSNVLRGLKKIVQGPFQWDEALGVLGFMNNETGFSSIITRDQRSAVFNMASTLPVRELNLERSGVEGVEELEFFSGSPIVKLNLSSNYLSVLNGLSEITPSLESLSIAANDFSCIDFDMLPKSTKIFYAHKNNATCYCLGEVGESKLTRISIYRNDIRNVDDFFKLPELERINLGANPVRSLPVSSNAQLRFLGVARTAITRIPDWVLESECIEEIDISYIESNLNKSHIDFLRRRGVRVIVSPFYVHQ